MFQVVDWLEQVRAVIRFIEEQDKRITEKKADRLEKLLSLRAVIYMCMKDLEEWMRWFERPEITYTIDDEELERVWNNISKAAKIIMEEDLRHTTTVTEKLAVTGPMNPFIRLRTPATQQEHMRTPESI
jgi:hypothetical protein